MATLIPCCAAAVCTVAPDLYPNTPITVIANEAIVIPNLKANPMMALICPASRFPVTNSPWLTTSGTKAHMNPVADVIPNWWMKRAT